MQNLRLREKSQNGGGDRERIEPRSRTLKTESDHWAVRPALPLPQPLVPSVVDSPPRPESAESQMGHYIISCLCTPGVSQSVGTVWPLGDQMPTSIFWPSSPLEPPAHLGFPRTVPVFQLKASPPMKSLSPRQTMMTALCPKPRLR